MKNPFIKRLVTVFTITTCAIVCGAVGMGLALIIDNSSENLSYKLPLVLIGAIITISGIAYAAIKLRRASRKAKVRYRILLLIGGCGLLSLLPIAVESSSSKIISDVSNIISCARTVATLYIALSLYQRFGADEVVIAKNLETVDTLLELIRQKAFYVESPVVLKSLDGRLYNALDKILLYKLSIEKDNYKHLHNQRLVFTVDFFTKLQDVISLAYSRYMPPEIAEKLLILEGVGFIAKVNNSRTYAKISVVHTKEVWTMRNITEEEAETDFDYTNWGLNDGHELTVLQFLNEWDGIIQACKDWLSENTSQGLNFPNYKFRVRS